ncbi:MAG TPA: pitrilysin family protein [Ottowia sp.]|uniref:M16 family metallopeptidase n=1 Tax=Ottowia sp. TaxID=1898956 RepID=UPI002CAD4D10|nr:pitrilysin family protein [Ottowia sp.]HMN20396.1 pitrilysin family protein [Ottowia sp.]
MTVPLLPRRAGALLASGAAALLLSACADAPLAPPAGAVPAQHAQAASAGIHEYRLDNGLTLIVKPDRRAPTAIHMLWVRVGSMDEENGRTGVAHVLEHMMFKGTDTLAPGEFSRRVAALGGRENAFTTRDYTGYFQQVPADRLADVMALEADRFAHSRYSDEEFAKELAVVKEERRMRTEDNPRALMFEQQMAATFTASPYRRPVVGWMGDLDSLTADDARAFYQRWYVPANAAVVVVGDVDPQAVLALARQTYGRIPARPVPVRKPQPEPLQPGERRIAVKAPAEQAVVSLAFKVPRMTGLEPSPDNDDALALTVLESVLDGYSGARLDRALTRGPNRVADAAGADNGMIGRGPQLFTLTGIPAQGKTAAQVEAALREQVARIAREGVSEAELARVKTQWIASQVYKRDSVMGQAQELGSLWVQQLPLDADERLVERLRAVTSARVQAVAARYFGDDQLTVATLLPQPRAGATQPAAAAAAAAGR